MEVHGGADTHLQPTEDLTPEQVDVPEGGCDPVGGFPPRWSRLLAGPVGRGAHAGAGLPAGLVTLWRGPTLEQSVPEGLQPVEGTQLEQFMKNCSLWEGPTLEQGKSVRSPLPEEEGVVETTCDELTATPIPRPHWGGEESQEPSCSLKKTRRESESHSWKTSLATLWLLYPREMLESKACRSQPGSVASHASVT